GTRHRLTVFRVGIVGIGRFAFHHAIQAGVGGILQLGQLLAQVVQCLVVEVHFLQLLGGVVHGIHGVVHLAFLQALLTLPHLGGQLFHFHELFLVFGQPLHFSFESFRIEICLFKGFFSFFQI